jgi:uncharacterized protein
VTTHTRDLSDTERDRLSTFLKASKPVQGMPLSALDGMFAAIAVGPGLVMPSVWIPLIWENRPPEFASETEAQEIMGLLMRFYNAVVHDINEGSYAPLLDVIVLENGKEIMTPEDWATGFIMGLRPRFDLWHREIGSHRGLGRMVDRMVKLAKPSDTTVKKLISPTQRAKILDPIPDLVLDIRDYWDEHGPKPGDQDHTHFASLDQGSRPAQDCRSK